MSAFLPFASRCVDETGPARPSYRTHRFGFVDQHRSLCMPAIAAQLNGFVEKAPQVRIEIQLLQVMNSFFPIVVGYYRGCCHNAPGSYSRDRGMKGIVC